MPSIVDRVMAYAGRAYRNLAFAMAKNAGVLPTGWVERDATSLTADGKTEIQPSDIKLAEEYRRSLWVYACVSKKARYAGGMPFLLKRARKGTDEVVTEHEALDVLWSPAPKKTWSRLAATMVVNMELSGRAYLEKANDSGDEEGVSDEFSGTAKQLWPMMPHKMKVVSAPREGVTQFIYTPNIKPQVFNPSRIVYWNAIDPIDEDGGFGAMLPGWVSNLLDRNAREWNRGFFERGAHPDIILKPVPGKQIRAADRERIEKDFVTRNEGTLKGRKPFVLPENVDYEESGTTHREIQFDRLLKASRSEIMAIFKTPPVLLGLLEDAAYATAWIQLTVFRDYEMIPLMDDLFAVLGENFLADFEDGADLYLEVDREAMLSQEERKGLYELANGSVQTGLLSLDEARELVGKGPKAKTVAADGGQGASGDGDEDAGIDDEPENRDAELMLADRRVRAPGTNGVHKRHTHPADAPEAVGIGA